MRAPVLAAGGIIWRPAAESATIELLLVHRPRYRDWSFPKGKLHEGESLLAAAVREVVEETGLSVTVGHRMPVVHYRTMDGPKEVTYWVMQPNGGKFVPNREVDEVRWVSIARARKQLTYRHDQRLLHELDDVPPGVVRVLLVRHAHAGQRKESDGHDITRPLSARGRRQARALADSLTLFAPTRVVSAPASRCVQTVEPLAQTLGLTVDVAPAFGEEEFVADPQAAAVRIEAALNSSDDVTVISSQGDVIPALIAGLPSAESLAPVVAKASVWALATRAGRVRADYYPPDKV